MKFIRDNLGYILLIGFWPSLFCISFGFMMFSETESSTFMRVGSAGFHLSLLLLVPLGVVNFFSSWRLSKVKGHFSTDADQLLEVLLGASGIMMVSLGAILSPYAYHMSLWFITRCCSGVLSVTA